MVGAPNPSSPAPRSSWQTLGTREVYSNPWIRVREDDVIRPDGSPGIYGVMSMQHPSVFVVALDDDARILIVSLYRYATQANSLEVPAGGCDGDAPLAAAQRELLEETGFRAANWREIGRMNALNGVCDAPEIVYLATGLTKADAPGSGDNSPQAPAAEVTAREQRAEGIEKVLTYSWPEIFDLIAAGSITDGETVAALMFAAIATGKLPAPAPSATNTSASQPVENAGASSRAVDIPPSRTCPIRLRAMIESDLPHLQGGDSEFDEFDDEGPGKEPRERVSPAGASAPGALVICDEETGEVLGNVSWIWVNWGPNDASSNPMIGIWLSRAARGRGIGSVAQKLLADYLFTHTRANRLEAHTDIENIAEQRALEKVGFTREGVIRAAQYRKGRFHDGYLYSILRDEWQASQPPQ